MKTLFRRLLLLVWLPLAGPTGAAALDSIGDIFFPVTASPLATEHFTLGVAYLHNFGFTQARDEFRRARQLEPGFAMAYWGEALSYNNPLGMEQDVDSPRQLLELLGPSASAIAARAPEGLERGFMTAAAALILTAGDAQVRREAYLAAMETLAGRYPRQQEVRAFLALALLSVAAGSPPAEQQGLRDRAAELSRALLQENPRHPGAAHYLIHSLDRPDQALAALPVAERYLEIAPVVAHARHMPSHIHLYLGHWAEVAELNETAFYTARALWRQGESLSELQHILEWGHYGDLQQANREAADAWLRRARELAQLDPADAGSSSLLERMQARQILELQQWQTGAVNAAGSADTLLAYGLSALALRDLALASEINQELKQRSARQPDAVELNSLSLALDGTILAFSGDETAGRSRLDAALQLLAGSTLAEGPPRPLKPLQELYGEVLLRGGHYREAESCFRQALAQYPHRALSLLGLARSLAGQERHVEAAEPYREILAIWGERNFAAASEAKTHLSIHAAQDPEAYPGLYPAPASGQIHD